VALLLEHRAARKVELPAEHPAVVEVALELAVAADAVAELLRFRPVL